MKKPINNPSLAEILDQFFLASDRPDGELLRDLTAKHPEYRRELISFALRWAQTIFPGEETYRDEADESSLQQFHSRVLQKLWEQQNVTDASSASGDKVQEAKKALRTIAGESEFDRVAVALNLSDYPVLVLKILVGSIKTLPDGLLSKLAAFIRFDIETTRAAHELIAQEEQALCFRAKNKPDACLVPQSWEEAVNELRLPPKETRSLLERTK